MKSPPPTTKKLFVLTIYFFIFTFSVSATDLTWVGSGAGGSGTDFNTAANWNPAAVPTSSDNVTMTLASNGSCSLSGNITVNNLSTEVQGNNDWYFRMAGNVLTVNGTATFNALNYSSSSDFSYLEIDCDGSPGGFVFNGNTNLHTNGTGDTYVTANTSNQGSMTFNADLTIGAYAYTGPAVEPTFIFDRSGTQTVTFNSVNHFKPAAFTFGVSNSPDVNFVNNNANEDYFTVYDGDVILNNSADVYLDNLNFDSWTGDGNISLNGSAILRLAADSDFPAYYFSTAISSTSTTSYEGDANQVVTAIASPGYGHLRIAGSNTKTSAADFSVRGDFISEGSWNDGNDTHTFNGTADQSIQGTVSPTFYNMVVNKSVGTLYIGVNTAVDNQLDMQDGPIDLSDGTNGYDLIINNTAVSAINWTSGSGAYLVSEKTDFTSTLSWAINTTTGTHIIPFGNAAGTEFPVYLTLSSGDIGIVSVATYPTADDNTPYAPTVTTMDDQYGTDNSANVVNRFWDLNKTNSGAATVRFYYADVDVPSGGESDLQPQRWSGSQWESHADSNPGGSSNDAANNYAEGVDITSFSPWTLATLSQPLPVEMLSYGAYCQEGGAVLNWSTASESDNDYFELQKSDNGIDFYHLAKVKGAGNSTVKIDYTYEDETLIRDSRYYRIKQVDMNGKYEYFGPFSIQACQKGEYYAYYSASIINLNLNLEYSDYITVELRDMSGKIISHYSEEMNQGLTTLELANNLSSGIYLIAIYSENRQADQIKILVP